MKTLNCLFFATLINSIFSGITEWTDPVTNTYFNYIGIQKEYPKPWVVKRDSSIFTDIYTFNFGFKLPDTCHSKQGSVIESMEITGHPSPSCSIHGQPESVSVRLINYSDPNEGIIVTYAGGDTCHNFHKSEVQPHQSSFYLYCNAVMDDNVIFYLFSLLLKTIFLFQTIVS
jgi:hypothetical protein